MKIFFAWEWGGGLSHLLRFEPLAKRLREEGHELLIASRDLTHVRRIFPRSLAAICQAPTFTGKLGAGLPAPQTIADLAWNLGFNAAARVEAQIEAFRELMLSFQPDVVVSDFGLSASIAAATLGLKRIRIGTGYECPPLCQPLAAMHFTDQPRTSVSRPCENPEQEVLEMVNQAMKALGLTRFERFCDLIGDEGQTLLATLPEVDPYRHVAGRHYLGVWQHAGGATPHWSDEPGSKVFAYLKSFPALPQLLETLERMRCNVALVADGITPEMLRSAGNRLRLQEGAVDLVLAAQQCDFAITNSTHGTSLQMLSLGIPVMGFPIFLEQRIVARSLDAQRLALHMNPHSHEHYVEGVLRAQSDAARRAVGEFASRRRAFLEESESRAWDMLKSLL